MDRFNLNSFYATEAALGFVMLAYTLMSTSRQAVMHAKIHNAGHARPTGVGGRGIRE